MGNLHSILHEKVLIIHLPRGPRWGSVRVLEIILPAYQFRLQMQNEKPATASPVLIPEYRKINHPQSVSRT